VELDIRKYLTLESSGAATTKKTGGTEKPNE